MRVHRESLEKKIILGRAYLRGLYRDHPNDWNEKLAIDLANNSNGTLISSPTDASDTGGLYTEARNIAYGFAMKYGYTVKPLDPSDETMLRRLWRGRISGDYVTGFKYV
jgi:hypothetical protein